MSVNFLTATLVSLAGYFTPSEHRQSTAYAEDSLVAETYMVDYIMYLVDLTKWTETTLGPVLITRTDYIRKVSNTTEYYVIPYFTMGQSIDCEPLTYSSKPTFVLKKDPDRKGIQYDYRLSIGYQPMGHSEIVSSRFTFPSGFADKEKEWWEASVAYPSKTVVVVIRFPADKPSKNISVSRKMGIKGNEPILHNLPSVSDGGRIVTWVGINEKGNSRIHFDWDW